MTQDLSDLTTHELERQIHALIPRSRPQSSRQTGAGTARGASRGAALARAAQETGGTPRRRLSSESRHVQACGYHVPAGHWMSVLRVQSSVEEVKTFACAERADSQPGHPSTV